MKSKFQLIVQTLRSVCARLPDQLQHSDFGVDGPSIQAFESDMTKRLLRCLGSLREVTQPVISVLQGSASSDEIACLTRSVLPAPIELTSCTLAPGW